MKFKRRKNNNCLGYKIIPESWFQIQGQNEAECKFINFVLDGR